MFQKPNAKTATNAATTVAAFVVGAKLGDGLLAVMPESVASYKKIIVGIGSLLLAASVNANTPASKGVQNALLGMGAKQLGDKLTETLTHAIAEKTPSAATPLSVVQKFTNAIVGHDGLASPYLAAAWDSEYIPEGAWDRAPEQNVISAGSMM